MSQAVWLKQQIIYSILTILRVRVQDQAPLIRFFVKDLPFSLLIQLQISRLSCLFLKYVKWDMPQGLCTCCRLPPSGCYALRPLHLLLPLSGCSLPEHCLLVHFFKANKHGFELTFISAAAAAAAAAASLQSCPTLCDPIDGIPPGSPVPGILQVRTLEWVAISFSSV